METATAVAMPREQAPSLISRMASRFGVEPNKMLSTLKATAFRGEVSNEQMMALLIVAEQYHLNPWVKEIYAFPDKNNGIVPVVGVDGWLRILNEHPQFNGIEFRDGPVTKDGLPEWIECTIYRRDREHPIVTREYMAECKRATGPWTSHPRRLLRHKALIQCARIAMSFVGIYDEDEAQRIIEGSATTVPDSAAVSDLNAEILGKAPAAPAPAPTPRKASKNTAAGAPDDFALDGTPTAGPSYAEVRAGLDTAKTTDDVDLAESLVDGLPQQFRAELHEYAGRRREAIEAAARG